MALMKLLRNTNLGVILANSKAVRTLSQKHDLMRVQHVKEKASVNCFEEASEDLSTLHPYYPNTFNLAAYINNSEILQNFLHLNLNLNKLEKKPHIVEKVLKLDSDSVNQFLFFIKDYVAVDEIGKYITKNPLLMCEPLEDLKVRVNYLQSKHFSNAEIHRIISNNPFWLMFSTSRIDKRLGYFQNKFNLYGQEVRKLTSKQPKLITYNLHHITTNTFVIKEEMGFNYDEVKKLLLDKPRLWMINQRSLLERFKYIHNQMKIPHSHILLNPEILFCRNFRVKQRHLFLQKLGRDQFDPKKENFVPIKVLVEDTDIEFCKKYAKCNVEDFNVFLKTL